MLSLMIIYSTRVYAWIEKQAGEGNGKGNEGFLVDLQNPPTFIFEFFQFWEFWRIN